MSFISLVLILISIYIQGKEEYKLSKQFPYNEEYEKAESNSSRIKFSKFLFFIAMFFVLIEMFALIHSGFIFKEKFVNERENTLRLRPNY